MVRFRLSFRRVEQALLDFGMKVPTYSALCKSRKRIPPTLFQRLMALTAGETHACVAIDSTGFSRTNPSRHYVKRIDRKRPVRYFVKQLSLFDVDKRVFVALRVKSKPRHDMKDALALVKQVEIQTLLADRAYDAEWLHQWCYEKGVHANIKPKLYCKKGLVISGFSDQILC